MLNLKILGRYNARKTYLGIVETLNHNARYNESQVIHKVILLAKEKNKLKPMFSYYEYYNILDSQPAVSYLDPKEKSIFGYISENQLQKAISRTKLKEAERLIK